MHSSTTLLALLAGAALTVAGNPVNVTASTGSVTSTSPSSTSTSPTSGSSTHPSATGSAASSSAYPSATGSTSSESAVPIVSGKLSNDSHIEAVLGNGTTINGTFSASESSSSAGAAYPEATPSASSSSAGAAYPEAAPSASSSAEPSATSGSTPTSGGAQSSPDLSKRAGGQSGQGTYYDVGLGSCGQTNSNSDMVAAMNAPQYDGGAGLTRRAGSSSCGKKLCVSGPKGQTTVTVVDKCPGCSSGDLDLSPSAFNQIADPSQGRVPITWSEC